MHRRRRCKIDDRTWKLQAAEAPSSPALSVSPGHISFSVFEEAHTQRGSAGNGARVLGKRRLLRRSSLCLVSKPSPATPIVSSEVTPVLCLRWTHRGVIHQLAQGSWCLNVQSLHRREEVVHVARDYPQDVGHGRASHKHGDHDEDPGEVEGLHGEEAEDGERLRWVYAAPEVDNGREEGRCEEGHVADEEGDGGEHEGAKGEAPDQVGALAVEARRRLEALTVAH
mmetsp:Transcript_12006/g.32249  ORF Transcript_12006/g.32249 Transcript_12006/m.32249 type:complete len:226 (-) Transcript_12006:266-943(-)